MTEYPDLPAADRTTADSVPGRLGRGAMAPEEFSARMRGPEVFAAALRELFTAAGSPTLTQAVAGAADHTPAGRAAPSVARVSNWRSGRHLPDSFAAIEPLLTWLTSTAVTATRSRDARTGDASVMSLPRWRALLTAAHAGTGTPLSLTERVTAAEALITDAPEHDTPTLENPVAGIGNHATGAGADGGSLAGAMVPVVSATDMHTAMLVLTGVDPVTGTTRAEAVRPEEVPVSARRVLDAAAMIEHQSPTPATPLLVRWSDPPPAAASGWPRLARLLNRYGPALATRTQLLDDAARWNTSPQRARLYSAAQLTVCGQHLITLPTRAHPSAGADPASGTNAGEVVYRFGGGATAADIPPPARSFWDASHAAMTRQLVLARMIMITIIAIALLAITTAAIAGWATSGR